MIRIIRSLIIISLLSILVFAGCELGEKEKDTSQILAEWDGGTITEKQFNERIDLIPEFYRPRGGFTIEQKQKYLDDYAIEEIFYLEALEKGVDKSKAAQDFYRQNAERIIIDMYYKDNIKEEIQPTEKEDMIHELDAVVALLYGLNEKQLIHIFETFHEGWDYEERLKATIKHFNAWSKRI